MLDLSYFQNSGNVNTQTFTTAGSWATWVKPRGAKFVNIFCMGAGGGGGAGYVTGSAVGTLTRCGGSGGGSGGLVRANFQASLLPDLLYVQCGAGGSGGIISAEGVQGGFGGSGSRSFVGVYPDSTSSSNLVVVSGNVAAVGGPGGFNVNGTGAAGETTASIANAIFLNLGTFISTAGQNGAASNVSNAGSITIAQINSSGAGGASRSTFPGGSITGAGPVPTLSGFTNQPSPNGIILYKPILAFTGGCGGGFSGAGIGFNGGNGSYGCGGGGGGAGTTLGTGNGGRGGDGLVIITTSF
jgi:hypothetical protein